MKTMIEYCLSNRVAANLFAFIIVVAGLIAAQNLNIRMFPQITLHNISINVPYPGATPSEVETSIIKPIEERLDGLKGIKKITSLAAPSVGNIVVKLDADVSISKLKNDIQTEIDRITVFPARSERPVITQMEVNELSARIILYGDVPPLTLKKAADRVRTDMADMDQISRVAIDGVPDYLIDISISEQSLQALGVSLMDVAERLSQQSLDLSGGKIEEDRQKILIRSTGERRSGAEFENVVMGASSTGSPIYLGDVATISDGLSESPIGALYKGKAASFISIYRVGDEQQLEQAENIRTYMANGITGSLPEGVEAEFWRDETVMIEERIDLLSSNAIIGLILVGVLLMAFLDLRIAAWVAFGVVVSFVGSLSLMAIFGITINQLTMFGFILAIGIVVDDAIVVGENIHSERKLGASTAMEAARKGVLKVSVPVLFSVTTTIVAFIPLIGLPGTMGQFIGPVAVVVIFVLMLSLLESFFILPRHLAHLSDRPPSKWSLRRVADPIRDQVASKLHRFVDRWLRPKMTAVIANPIPVLLVAGGLFMASMSLLSGGVVKVVFFPEVEGDYIMVDLELPESSSQDQTIRWIDHIADSAVEINRTFNQDGDALRGIFRTIGNSPALDQGVAKTSGGAAANKGFLVARIKSSAKRQFSAEEFVAAWREKVGEIPGAQKLTFTADLVSPGAPVYLEVSTRLAEDAWPALKAMRDVLESTPGVYDIRDNRFRTTDEVRVSIKPLALSYGLTQQDLAGQVRASFFGAEATRVQRDREEIQVRVRLPRDERYNLEALKSLRIKVGDGFIPITNLADLTIEPAPATINRIDGRKIYTLTAEVDRTITTAGIVTDNMLNTVVPELGAKYDGINVTLSGDQEEQSTVGPVIGRNFLIALMVIFTLLALSFKSYSQPLIVMLAIPFGFMGAIIGHAVMGKEFTLLSIFGVIGLSGVIINNSLMVLTFINERLESGEDAETAIREGTLQRFRAILLTTLTTFLGVTPIMLETSAQAQFLIPTAIALGFGIIIGTAMLIFTLPALAILHYRVFGRSVDVDQLLTPKASDGQA